MSQTVNIVYLSMQRIKLLGLLTVLGLTVMGAGCQSAGSGDRLSDIDPTLEAQQGGWYADAQVVRGNNTTVRPSDILLSGQSEDTFPSLVDPSFMTVEEANESEVFYDALFGYAVETEEGSRFYSSQILAWHTLVHDTIDGQPVLVAYSPLAGAGGVYAREDGETFKAGSYAWNSDFLFEDEATGSLWSVLREESVYGKRAGEDLERVAFRVVSWADWSEAHPDGQVLSTDNGYSRRYDLSPYGNYILSRKVLFETSEPYDAPIEPKGVINGVVVNGQAKGYQEGVLVQQANGVLNDTVADTNLVVWADAEVSVLAHARPDGVTFARVADGGLEDEDGNLWTLNAEGDLTWNDQVAPSLNPISTFWFAWKSMHPETEIYAFIQGQGVVNGAYSLEDGDGIEVEEETPTIEVDDDRLQGRFDGVEVETE